jgi:hypothetical protein
MNSVGAWLVAAAVATVAVVVYIAAGSRRAARGWQREGIVPGFTRDLTSDEWHGGKLAPSLGQLKTDPEPFGQGQTVTVLAAEPGDQATGSASGMTRWIDRRWPMDRFYPWPYRSPSPPGSRTSFVPVEHRLKGAEVLLQPELVHGVDGLRLREL